VTSIESYAFYNCTRLTRITMEGASTRLWYPLTGSNTLFKDAYLAGGAGTYTGTWDGAWARLSSNATITGGALEGEALTGNFTGGANIGASTELTVTVVGGAVDDIFGLIKGNANSVINYIVGSGTPANDAAYTLTYVAPPSTNLIDTTSNTIIWLRVTAEDTTTKLYYKITATAASSDATLSTSSTVKGQVVIGLGTPNAVLATATAGAVTITAAQAADISNTGDYITLFVKTNVGATVKVVKYATGGDTSGFAGAADYSGAAITNGDFFIVKVTAADATVLYYKVVVTAPLKIGDSYGGGKVAYILQSGETIKDASGYVLYSYSTTVQHGLIAATADQSTGIIWAVTAYQSTSVPGTLTTLGSGAANTDKIIAQQNGADITTYAAGLARACTDGSYSDWYLPSKDELNKLWENLGSTQEMRTANGFASYYYWSSTELNSYSNDAEIQDFGNGYQYNGRKDNTFYVRAVRAF